MPAPERCVWCGALLGQLQTPHVDHNAGASKDTSLDEALTVNCKRGGRSPRSNAKRRATRILVQVFYFLNGRSSLRMPP
jgi:hypothetical protein